MLVPINLVRASSPTKIVYVVICVDTESPSGKYLGSTDPNPTMDVSDYSSLPYYPVDQVFDSSFRNSIKDPSGNTVKFTWFMETDYLYSQSTFVNGTYGSAGVSGYMAMLDLMEKDWGPQMQAYGDEIEYHHHFEYYDGTWVEDYNGPDAAYPGYQMTALDHMIIDNSFYPTVFRSGWNIVTQPLSNWIEQWFPFDYSPTLTNPDLSPVHAYPGMNHWQTQSNYLELYANAQAAFISAETYGNSIYSVSMHEDDDMAGNVTALGSDLNTLAYEYPDVTFEYVTATQAMQLALGLPSMAAPTFTVTQNSGTYVITSSQTLWGNHPYIALEYSDGTYTNMAAEPVAANTWTVTVPNLANCIKIGVAGSDLSGNPGVDVFSPLAPPQGPIPAAPTPPPSGPPEVQVPINGVTASIYNGLAYNPGMAIDGTPSTSNYWDSGSSNGLPQSLTLDLWSLTTINQVTTHFYDGTSRAYTYYIQVSADGSSWTTVVPTKSGSGVVTDKFSPVEARFVNITITGNTANTAAQIEQISVYQPTPIIVTVTPMQVTIDAGQSKTFSSSVSGGTTPFSYQWLQKAPGAPSYSSISGATSSSYSFATTVSTTTGTWSFELQMTDATETIATSSAISVLVNPAPSVIVSPSSWTMDIGQSKTFTATASGGSGTYTSYQWYVGGIAQSGATASTFNYSPASSGSHPITATVTDSLAATSAQSPAATVTVNASPTLSIAPVGPLTIDIGQVQVFTATASGGSGSLSYQWYLDGASVGTNSASYSYTASGTSHSITCKVTDSASIPVTSTASNTVSVTVHSALVAPTASASKSTVDQGQTSSLTSTAVSTGTSPYTYQWLQKAPGAPSYSSISGATSSSYSFATTGSTASGVWSFELQVTDSASTPVVVTSTAVSVAVNAAPIASISPTSWTMDAGQSKTFTATPSGGSGTYTSYQWYVGGSAQSGATASTFSFTPASSGSYSITVTVTDSLSATSAQSTAATVTVNSALVTPTASASKGTVDQGQTSSLTSTAVSTGTSPYTYQWLEKAPGGSYVDVGTNSASYFFVTSTSTATGVWSFELQVTDSASTPVVITSAPVSVTVNTAPTVSVSPSSWAMDIGQSKTFTATAGGGSGTYTGYQWYVGGFAQSGATASTFSYSPGSAGTFSITVTVTDSLGATSAQSTAATVTVNPTVSVSPTSWTMDIGQSQTFTATASGGSGTYTGYQWYVGSIAQSGATASTFNYSPASASSYSITVTVTDSLGATSPQSSAATVTVNAAPTVSIAPVGPLTLDAGQVQTFTATASGGIGALTYQWYLDGTAVGSNSASYTYTAAGTSHSITCTVTDSASAPDTSPSSNTISVAVNSPMADVVRGSNNCIYYSTYNSNTASWSSWNCLPTGTTMDSPAATVVSDTLYVVVRGMDGESLWFGSVNLADDSFSGWTLLSGSTSSTPTLTSNGTALRPSRTGQRREHLLLHLHNSHAVLDRLDTSALRNNARQPSRLISRKHTLHSCYRFRRRNIMVQ